MTPEFISFLVGLIMPVVVEFVKVSFSVEKRWQGQLIAMITTLAIGTLTVVLDGKFDTAQIFVSASLCMTAAQTSYNTWWKGLELDKKMESKLK